VTKKYEHKRNKPAQGYPRLLLRLAFRAVKRMTHEELLRAWERITQDPSAEAGGPDFDVREDALKLIKGLAAGRRKPSVLLRQEFGSGRKRRHGSQDKIDEIVKKYRKIRRDLSGRDAHKQAYQIMRRKFPKLMARSYGHDGAFYTEEGLRKLIAKAGSEMMPAPRDEFEDLTELTGGHK
jgi:hypothetical protein